MFRNNVLTLSVLLALTTIGSASPYNGEFVQRMRWNPNKLADLAMTTVHEMKYLRHYKTKEEKEQIRLQQSYDSNASEQDILDQQLAQWEEFIFGLLKGASFVGNPECTASMEAIVYYAFEVAKYREVYVP